MATIKLKLESGRFISEHVAEFATHHVEDNVSSSGKGSVRTPAKPSFDHNAQSRARRFADSCCIGRRGPKSARFRPLD